jgi:hypothetical protein
MRRFLDMDRVWFLSDIQPSPPIKCAVALGLGMKVVYFMGMIMHFYAYFLNERFVTKHYRESSKMLILRITQS